jgi:hypothetical protein
MNMGIIDDQKAPCYVNVHFHALLVARLGFRCYRSEDKYKFDTADGRHVSIWPNMYGEWVVKHNIRSDYKFSDWEEADFLEKNHTTVRKIFRMKGMGMMTRDLSNFASFVKKHFNSNENILKYLEKRQFTLF